MSRQKPTYLGDGLYASFDGMMVAIHKGDHRAAPSAYFEAEVVMALMGYARACFGEEVWIGMLERMPKPELRRADDG